MNDWDESEHPRWPAGTPGGRGGEFREDWVQGVLLQMDITPEQEILEILRDGKETGRTNLAGGNSAATDIVEFQMPDGSTKRLVNKVSGQYDVQHETLASAIGWAIGAPVPTVVPDPDNPRGLWMPLIDGYSPMQRLVDDYRQLQGEDTDEDVDFEALDEGVWDYVADGEMEVVEEYAYGDDGVLLGLLDILLRNSDRHAGNWLIRYGLDRDPYKGREIMGIDHTHIDATSVLDPSVFDDEDDDLGVEFFTGSPFAKALVPESDYDDDPDAPTVINWHPADIAEVQRHLEALFRRPDIARLLGEMQANPEAFLSRLRWVGKHANPGSPRRFE